jgi:shikimate kinase
MRVFLVGFMGSGKSTTGRALAHQVGSLFWDLDARVEARLGMPVSEVFARHGEPVFRAAETKQLDACGRVGSLVVATGGGTFCTQSNRDTIKRLGTSVFLDVSWGEVLRRLPGKQGERPLFATPEQAHSLYLARLPLYRTADVSVRPEKGEEAEALAARIAMLLQSRV